MRKMHYRAYLSAPRQVLATGSLLLGGLSRTWYFLHGRTLGYEQSTIAIICSTYASSASSYLFSYANCSRFEDMPCGFSERDCPEAEINRATSWTSKLSLQPVLHAALQSGHFTLLVPVRVASCVTRQGTVNLRASTMAPVIAPIGWS